MSGENTDPRAEPGIGRSLEEARQSRGLSLREVEQRTRIRSRYLRDLEREDFDVLPAVYVLGSLKTYADFLGLDGAALSGQLKARLTEPDEPEAYATVRGDADEREDEFEAAPVPAVGFDQLFLGMGVILISILAIMTLATAVAQGDRSPVSQVDQPSTLEPPSEVALAGNTQEEGGEAGAPENGASQKGEDGPEDPEASNVSGDEQGEKRDASGGNEDLDASRATSAFGDAEFVPMSPSSASTGTLSTASATSAASAAPASATARTEDRPSSPAPATADASSRPAVESQAASAPAPPPNAPDPAGSRGAGRPSPPASGAGPIPPVAARVMDETFRLNGP